MSVYLDTPLRLDKICRACLTEKGDMKPLFGACLDEMLVSFASIQVNLFTSYQRTTGRIFRHLHRYSNKERRKTYKQSILNNYLF